MAWRIAETAPEKDKIKAEFAYYICGLKSRGVIDRNTYSELFDFGMDLIDEMYDLGVSDGKRKDDENAVD